MGLRNITRDARPGVRLVPCAAALLLAAATAGAEGFRTSDLTRVDTSAFPTAEHGRSQEPDRLTLAPCGGDFTGVDLQLGRRIDGAGDRVRSGATTIGELRAACEAATEAGGSACRDLEAAPLGGAVGWRTRTQAMGLELTTHVLMRDDELLTIRAMAEDRAEADAMAGLALDVLAPQIVAP